ncbi:uncharacterized protein TEOVI_000397400 [Trypanosoma equiperdum]|uniref:OmpA-like domain-containing protein n=2 Tax=Trypanozoon TaxID=39700 RepID=A0A1G4IJA7_TRYEQ|nr:hypothetical protein DPX39_100022600 [Trypanosoma brucei equiperdum]SCU72398.1 hypothetical protein, conserved [Trypanosoma equiperdum]
MNRRVDFICQGKPQLPFPCGWSSSKGTEGEVPGCGFRRHYLHAFRHVQDVADRRSALRDTITATGRAPSGHGSSHFGGDSMDDTVGVPSRNFLKTDPSNGVAHVEISVGRIFFGSKSVAASPDGQAGPANTEGSDGSEAQLAQRRAPDRLGRQQRPTLLRPCTL